MQKLWYAVIAAVITVSSVCCVTMLDGSDSSDAESAGNAASIGSTEYATVEDALSAAVSGDTVRILRGCTISSDVEVKDGVTLLIPYSDSDNSGHSLGQSTNDTTAKITSSSYLYIDATVDTGVTVTVYGKIVVGGITARPFTFDYQGHTSADYSQMTINGNVVLKDGAVLDCYGFIKGSGTIDAEAGSSVYEPLVITDYVGGDYMKALAMAGQSPFNRYSLMNIQCTMTIHGKQTLSGECASLYGHVVMYANDDWYQTDITFIGSSDSFLTLSKGAYATLTYDSGKYVNSDWSSNICKDIGRTIIAISGGASFGSFSITYEGYTVDVGNLDFSIPYNFDITLNNGNYTMSKIYRIMPGASVTVSSDAVLNIIGKMTVYPEFNDTGFRDKYYPTSELLGSYGFSSSGSLVVNGTLKISGPFAGTVTYGSDGGRIIVNDTASVLSQTVTFGCDFTNEGRTATAVTINLFGQYADADGTVHTMASGCTYVAKDGVWTADSQSDTVYESSASADSSYNGGTDECTVSLSDVNNAISEIINASDSYSETVLILNVDTSGYGASRTKVTISADALSAIIDAGTSLRIVMGTGTAEFDASALSSISGELSFEMGNTVSTEVTDSQSDTAGGRTLKSISISIDGTVFAGNLDGAIKISIPYSPDVGENMSDVQIWYIDGNADAHKLFATYSSDGYVVFYTTHCSLFAISFDDPVMDLDYGVDVFKIVCIVITVAAAIAVISILYYMHRKKSHKM